MQFFLNKILFSGIDLKILNYSQNVKEMSLFNYFQVLWAFLLWHYCISFEVKKFRYAMSDNSFSLNRDV